MEASLRNPTICSLVSFVIVFLRSFVRYRLLERLEINRAVEFPVTIEACRASGLETVAENSSNFE